jgi:hypothetical protein
MDAHACCRSTWSCCCALTCAYAALLQAQWEAQNSCAHVAMPSLHHLICVCADVCVPWGLHREAAFCINLHWMHAHAVNHKHPDLNAPTMYGYWRTSTAPFNPCVCLIGCVPWGLCRLAALLCCLHWRHAHAVGHDLSARLRPQRNQHVVCVGAPLLHGPSCVSVHVHMLLPCTCV